MKNTWHFVLVVRPWESIFSNKVSLVKLTDEFNKLKKKIQLWLKKSGLYRDFDFQIFASCLGLEQVHEEVDPAVGHQQ